MLKNNSKIIFMLIMPLFFACKSVSISEIKKQYVRAGSKFDTSKMKYSAIIESPIDSFKILSVEIADKKFKNITIIEIPNGKIKNQKETLFPGKYYIDIKVEEALFSKESIETLKLNILVKEKLQTLKGKSVIQKDLLRK
ncbi:hypothetical protein [Tenacibaculum piscium]|uniref:hypothetical protein n=1 Tax=Tenacibaculum piscium TaxID=1458515 RepID=UPI001F1E1C57|nr:hypothetical protein [Tenacibaculum piscium]